MEGQQQQQWPGELSGDLMQTIPQIHGSSSLTTFLSMVTSRTVAMVAVSSVSSPAAPSTVKVYSRRSSSTPGHTGCGLLLLPTSSASARSLSRVREAASSSRTTSLGTTSPDSSSNSSHSMLTVVSNTIQH